MAWTTPMTAIAGQGITSDMWNEQVRDNFNETAPAKATTAGAIFAAAGPNQIAERYPTEDRIATNQSTSSTAYTDLATVGPSVSVVCGSTALVSWATSANHNTNNHSVCTSVAVSGDSTVAASDNWMQRMDIGLAGNGERMSMTHLFTGLTPGTNTFTVKYRVGVSGTGNFWNRSLVVIPF